MNEQPPKGPVPNPILPAMALGPVSRGVLVSLAEAVIPPEPFVPDVAVRLVDFIRGFIAYMPPAMRRLFPVGLWLLEFGTVLFGFSWKPFSWLSLEDRRRYLKGWARSRSALRRQLLKGVRGLVVLGYYDIPEVKAYVGYEPGPFVTRLQAERAQRYRARGLPVVTEPHDVVHAHSPRADEASPSPRQPQDRRLGVPE